MFNILDGDRDEPSMTSRDTGELGVKAHDDKSQGQFPNMENARWVESRKVDLLFEGRR